MSRLRPLVVPAVLVGLIVLAGVSLDRVYAGTLLVPLVAGAAAGSVVVSLACRRLPSWLVAPLSVLGLAAYTGLALTVAMPAGPAPEPFARVVADALGNGIPRLLTAMIPVEPRPDTVAVPVVAAWLTGLAGAELAGRTGRVLLGFAPAVALYAGAGYVIGPNATGPGWPAVGFAVLVAVGLAGTARAAGLGAPELSAQLRASLRVRAALGVAGGLAAVVALTAAVGPWLGGQVATAPVDPRRYVQPPRVDSLDESPLNRISGWALDPEQLLFDVAADGPGRAPGRIRLAVLPDYDGVTWRVGATYRNAGRVLPAAGAAAGAAERVRQRITVAELTGRLLPATPTPQTVDGTRVAFDPATGTLIRPEGLRPGLRYAVTSVAERPDVNLLPAADVPAGEPVARFLRLGDGGPPQLRRLAEHLAEANGAPYERAAAVEQFLGGHYRLVADAPSGHAYPNLSFFLFGPRHGGGQQGTSEQFAAAFAVLGRLMGLPTRVVVGFDVPAGGGPVRGSAALAWPEVLFDELGWVAFDPLPRPDTTPRPVEEDFDPRPERSPPSAAPSSAPTQTPTRPPPVLAAPPGRGPAPLVLAGGGVLGGAVVVAAAAGLLVALRRAQRRRRLTTGDPAGRVAGAWLELTDALRLAGRPVPGHLAATEVVRHAVTAAREAPRPAPDRPVPPLDELAGLVNTSAFAPGGIDAGPAGRAAAQAVSYAAELRSRRSWWRRLWWSVHPGPLRWHRRPGRAGTDR